MTVDHLHRFLIDVQKQGKATREDAQSIINAASSLLHRNGLHLDAFFKYLFGDNNSPLAGHVVTNSLVSLSFFCFFFIF